jgi:hypothetical protein
MGAFEREADRHADEMGRLEARENYAEQRFLDERESLAETLASGQSIQADGKALDYDDLLDHLYINRDDQLRAAFRLCMVSEALGGRHLKRILEESATELVDKYAKEFRSDMEKDYEH